MGETRLFVYLDGYKMYSISSQIFEGLTEYALRYSDKEVQNTEEQKGPVASGRLLANIVGERTGAAEKRFFHDYGYTLFEEQLISNKRVLVIGRDSSLSDINEKLLDYPFVKVSGKAVFNDIARVSRTVSEFNAMGEALAYITNFQALEVLTHELNERIKVAKGQEKNLLREQLKAMTPSELAKSNNLHQDPVFLEKLAYMLDFGYKDEFEIQIATPFEESGILFSAPLAREFFTEKEDVIVRKYGRKTEAEFTIFGIVTQSGRPRADVHLGDSSDSQGESDLASTLAGDHEPDPGAIKRAIRTLVHHLSDIEDTFTGRVENEIIIDPIAVYRQL